MMHGTVSVAVIAALAGCASFAGATVISDTTFDSADWALRQSGYGPSGSTSDAWQVVGGGYTGNARAAGNDVVGNGSGIYGISILMTQSWSGAAPLESLQMSIRARRQQSLQAFGFAIEQGGNHWIAGYFLNTAAYDLYALDLTATDFSTPYGVDPASQPSTPDFSAGAAPIHFGFYVANSSTMYGDSTIGYYSDFTVNFVPAPGVATLLAVAGLRGRRRG